MPEDAVQEIEELFVDIPNSRTDRLDGLLEFPLKCRPKESS
jgi:hypothetical protein